MILPSSQFVVLAGYIQGLDSVTQGRLLKGFDQWTAVRNPGLARNIGWPWQIAYSCIPDNRFGSDRSLDELTSAESELAKAALFDALEVFLGERGEAQLDTPDSTL
jgi:hypothetical protein